MKNKTDLKVIASTVGPALFAVPYIGWIGAAALGFAGYICGDKYLRNRDNATPIPALLERDESDKLEFKGSLEFDPLTKKQNKKIRTGVLKTLAAFMNSKGGELIIGIQDDKAVLGIEGDLSLHKGSLDKFEQHLNNLITDALGKNVSKNFVISFPEAGDRKVCCIKAHKSSSPVFLKKDNKSIFYVRAGNTTRECDAEEQHKYIKQHWE